MATDRRTQASTTTNPTEVPKPGIRVSAENDLETQTPMESLPSEPDAVGLESARVLLRQRWELASVINFLNVFGSVIGDVKMSAEDIESGLIVPDIAIGKLHVVLLKGIRPTSKNLNDSDAWVTVLSKKLKEWWRWVAEGDLPLPPSNGLEMHKYKELDPVTRLLILKALCELRADQEDAVFYINDALKNGTEMSFFRKENIGKDARGATYWCDKDAANGFRLYKEVMKKGAKKNLKDNGCWNKLNLTLQWETVATNLQEFLQITDELSSSNSVFEVAIGRTVENEALLVLERIEKKKQQALKKQERDARLMNNYRNSLVLGTTRSCRIRRPVTYTFDDYDTAIDEAIHVTRSRKVTDEARDRGKLNDNEPEKGGGVDNIQFSDIDSLSENISAEGKDRSETTKGCNDIEHIESDGSDMDYDGNENEYQGIDDDDADEIDNVDEQDNYTYKHFGSRWSTRLANTNGNIVSQSLNVPTRTLRQRPARNHVVESEDEEMFENEISNGCNHVVDSEDEEMSNNET